jgi:hypothetical protein
LYILQKFENLFKFIYLFLICCSDEDDEDEEALLYLPVTPEIEEPEEGWQGDGPVSMQQKYCLKYHRQCAYSFASLYYQTKMIVLHC